MLKSVQIEKELHKLGFRTSTRGSTKKVRKLTSETIAVPIYLKVPSPRERYQLVIHPSHRKLKDVISSVSGVSALWDDPYRNSNMTEFPRADDGQSSAFGIPIAVRDRAALETLIGVLETKGASHESEASILRDTTLQEDSETPPPIETTRQALIDARKGQGLFRERLFDYWRHCAVTKLNVPDLLRASHIKPWRHSSDQERLDPFNGLLLGPSLDAAFDSGLITFSESGELVPSSSLGKPARDILGIRPGMHLRKIDSRHEVFLDWHRKHVFYDRDGAHNR